MVSNMISNDDWNTEILAGFDGKGGSKADGKINEEEFVKAAGEATSGAVGDAEAKKWFAEMTGFDGEGENPNTVSVSRLEKGEAFKGHFKENLDNVNKKAIDAASFNNPEVFDKIDVEPKDGKVSLVELKTYIKDEMPNGKKIPDAAIDQWFKNVSGGDGNISKEDFSSPDLTSIPADVQGRIITDENGTPVLDENGNYKALDGSTLTNDKGQSIRPPTHAEQLQRAANAEAEKKIDPLEALMEAIEELVEALQTQGFEAAGLGVAI